MQTNIAQPFNNAQLELLKMFSRPIPENELLELKRLIVRHFAKKAIEEANKVWDTKGLDSRTILQTHLRTPYKRV